MTHRKPSATGRNFRGRAPVRTTPLRFVLGFGLAVRFLGGCGDADRLVGSIVATDTAVDDAATPTDAPAVTPSWVDAPFAAPVLISELAISGVDIQDPTLTGDELEMYFTYTLAGQLDIWTTTRSTAQDAWGAPHRVAELSSDSSDSTPEVSPDGLTIYLASNRSGGTYEHLWQSGRSSRTAAWNAPVRVTDPAPATSEVAPSLDATNLWLAFASVRDTNNFDLYLASRATPTDPWGPLTALTSLDSKYDDWDPALFFRRNAHSLFIPAEWWR